MGITETCSRIIGGFVNAINGVSSEISNNKIISKSPTKQDQHQYHKTMITKNNTSQLGQNKNSMQARALITVFGMRNDGKIQKDKARQVVEKLGLIGVQKEEEIKNHEGYNGNLHDQAFSFDLPGDHDHEEVVAADEILDGPGDGLLRRAFEIFDENGNGFIEALELKRVLECLGLDCGWGLDEVEKMLRAVDLNLDGKVDFGEFEIMMMGMNSNTNSDKI